MGKTFTTLFASLVVLGAILTVFYFIDREQEVDVENVEDGIVQGEEVVVEQDDVMIEEFDEFLDEQAQQQTELPSDEFIQCLVDSGMVVYASKTCPACTSLANEFGGYDAAGELFVLCGDDWEKCDENMQTNYVPEIQYNGELFEGGRSMQAFSDLTGCEL